MKPSRITQILKEFSEDKTRAILIDGAWGIGKTHFITEYLNLEKSKKKEKQAIYVSLFGKESIDELHNELYAKTHPKLYAAAKIALVVSKTAALFPNIPDASEGLEFALNMNDKHISKNVKMIIFDDLERKSSKLSFDVLLGYFNQLFLSKIKVVGVCCSKEIKGDDSSSFKNFSEKIFDRHYKIISAERDVIGKYFEDDAELLDEKVIAEFENNLRQAQRTAFFYKRINIVLSEHNPDFQKILSKKSLLWYSTLMTISANSSNYAQKNQSLKEKSELDKFNESYRDERIKGLQTDDMMGETLLNILEHDDEISYSGRVNTNLELCFALYYAYYYNDFEGIKQIFTSRETMIHSDILGRNLFYENDVNKKDLIKKQYEYLLSCNEVLSSKHTACIGGLFYYYDFSDGIIDETALVKKVIEMSKEDEKEIYSMINFGFMDAGINERDKHFRKRLIDEFHAHKLHTLIDEFITAYKKNDLSRFIELLEIGSNKSYARNGASIADELYIAFEKNGFFLPDISGTMDEIAWSLCHSIARFMKENNHAKDMTDFLLKINVSTNKSFEERITALITSLK